MNDRIGQQFGNYRLLRLLGQGGFAEVYLGEHLYLQTPAAIKILHTKVPHEEKEQFINEARTVANLLHPYIVRVLEFGVQDTIPFLVMEYAPNGNMRQRYPRGTRLLPMEILLFLKQVVDALHYAHEEKLIHRDIKPENMLLSKRGDVLLADFGIAVVSQSSRYQSTQQVIGTAAYMAPEQIQGKPQRASDQYSLGIVLYEWLTGDRPFHGTFPEIGMQHLLAPPPPMREKAPALSPDIEHVVMTALAKDPAQRFATVQLLAEAFVQACREKALPEPTISTSPEGTYIQDISIQPPPPATSTNLLPTDQPLPQRLKKRHLIPIKPLSTHSPIRLIKWSPNNQRIAIGSAQELQIWNATSEHHDFSISCPIGCFAWSPDGTSIATYGNEILRIWDTTHGQELSSQRIPFTMVYSFTWSPNGACLAFSGRRGQVHIWEISSERCVLTYSGHTNSVGEALVWSPDSQYIVSGSKDNTAQIWNAATGKTLCTYQGHTKSITCVAWSPDAQHILSGGEDRTLQVWDAMTGDHIHTYLPRSLSITERGYLITAKAITWSSDKKYILSASGNGDIQIWNTISQQTNHIFHIDSLKHIVAWSSDGTYLAGYIKKDFENPQMGIWQMHN